MADISREDLVRVQVESAGYVEARLAWEIILLETYSTGGTIRRKTSIPYEMPAWRVAEYGFDPAEVDALVEMIVCEMYFPPEEMQATTVPLWSKPTIAEARQRYMELLVATKLKYRISTRGASNPMSAVKEQIRMHPADISLKSLGVILQRHRMGLQELDPDVAKAIGYMEKAVAMMEGSDNSTSVSSEGR